MKHNRYRTLCLLLLLLVLVGWLKGSGGMEQHLLYYPDPQLVGTPASFGLPYEDVALTTADGVALHGWYIPGEEGKPVVLFCHGNAGNISHRLDNILLLHRLGVTVFIFDYRGYGRSQGRPDEDGLTRDAEAALAWLQDRGWAPRQTVYFGRSLGTGVAVNLAARHAPAQLILETPFTSLREMGRTHYPLLTLLCGWLLNDRYDNLTTIKDLQVPLLILQGDRDTLVPEAMARRLFAAANPPKRFHLITGADHNDTYEQGGAPYWQAWHDFLFGPTGPTD